MTANEMLPAIGAGVSVQFESIRILCTVKDVKHVYGRPRLLIAPQCGAGEQWVELSRLRLVNGAKTDPREMCALTQQAYR